MNNVNWVTLLPALLGVLKLILQPFGIDLSHIADAQVNDVVNGVSALVAIWGIFVSHNKTGGVTSGPAAQYPGDGPAV